MNCLTCRKHSLWIMTVDEKVKTYLTCWGTEVKGGKPVPYKPEEVGTYVVTAPDWCPLAKETEIK